MKKTCYIAWRNIFPNIEFVRKLFRNKETLMIFERLFSGIELLAPFEQIQI